MYIMYICILGTESCVIEFRCHRRFFMYLRHIFGVYFHQNLRRHLGAVLLLLIFSLFSPSLAVCSMCTIDFDNAMKRQMTLLLFICPLFVTDSIIFFNAIKQ